MSGRRDLRDVSLAAGRHLVSVVAGLATIPLVAHHLGAEGLGAWALLGTTAFMLGASDLGLGLSAQRAQLAGRDVEPVVETALTLVSLLAPLLALGGWWLTGLAAPEGAAAGDFYLGAAIALGGGGLGALGHPLRALLVAAGEMRALTRLRVTAAAFQVVGTAVGLWCLPRLATVAAIVACALTAEAYGIVRLTRSRGVRLRWRLGSLRRVPGYLREGGAGLAIDLGGLVASRADVLVLAVVARETAEPLLLVAAYGVAARLVDQSYTVAKQTSAALLPRLGPGADAPGTVRRGTAIMGALVGGGMVALATCGQPWMILWAGEAGAQPEAQRVLTWLAVAALVQAAHEVAAASVTMAAESPWSSAGPIVAGHAANVAVTWAGASTFGVEAIAGGHLAGALVTAGLIWPRARRLHRWDGAAVLRCLAPQGAAVAAALLVASVMPRGTWLTAGVSALVIVAAGLAAAWAAFAPRVPRVPRVPRPDGSSSL